MQLEGLKQCLQRQRSAGRLFLQICSETIVARHLFKREDAHLDKARMLILLPALPPLDDRILLASLKICSFVSLG